MRVYLPLKTTYAVDLVFSQDQRAQLPHPEILLIHACRVRLHDWTAS